MAEDTYRQYKEISTSVTQIRKAERMSLILRRRQALQLMRRQKSPAPRAESYRVAPAEYSVWKAMLADAVEGVKTEIQEQHGLTRQEILASRRDLLTAVTKSPSHYVKSVCELAVVFVVFVLLVQFAFGIILINTFFAAFMLFSCSVYWLMALVKQRSDRDTPPNCKP